MGSQFDLFLFYCSPLEKFFDFKNTIFRRPFLTPGIFYCDGRWMVDGGGWWMVVVDGGWWWWMVDGRKKGSPILLKIFSDEVQVI